MSKGLKLLTKLTTSVKTKIINTVDRFRVQLIHIRNMKLLSLLKKTLTRIHKTGLEWNSPDISNDEHNQTSKKLIPYYIALNNRRIKVIRKFFSGNTTRATKNLNYITNFVVQDNFKSQKLGIQNST